MTPAILVIDASGNIMEGICSALPGLFKMSETLQCHRIIAIVTSVSRTSARWHTKTPSVELIEQDWAELDATWLRANKVVRAFIASHNRPNQFAEESQFHVEALSAGVKYVVRISTAAANVRPDHLAYLSRTHWAIKTMLSQPTFKDLQWSSLQHNVFLPFILWQAVEFVKEHRTSGEQATLGLLLDSESPVGVIDPKDVGVFAAHLLAQEDTTPHDHARYVLNGPEIVTGRLIVDMVESIIGEKVKRIQYKDVSFIEQWANMHTSESRNVIRSVAYAPVALWDGDATAWNTSQTVIGLAPPKGTALEFFRASLEM
jgi:uncharacterized protein YbjT (DUF2867 family)